MAVFVRARSVGAVLWCVSVALYGSTAFGELQIPKAPELASLPAWAQEKVTPTKRALVVGINDYQYAKDLETPQYDAELVSDSLRRLDPKIALTLLTQQSNRGLSRDELLDQFEVFRDSLRPGDITVLYFSGHGIEVAGVNYLVPADANISLPGEETSTYISLSFLIEQIQGTRAAIALVILDACRSNPFSVSIEDSEHLDLQSSPPALPSPALTPLRYLPRKSKSGELSTDFLVFFAAQAGQPSFSLLRGDNPKNGSIFTRNLLQLLTTENKSAYTVFGLTSKAVARLTEERQIPLIASSTGGEVMFLDNQNLARDELETWIRTVVRASDDELISALNTFIDNYPAGPFSATARKHLSFLQASRGGASPSVISVERDVGLLGGSLMTPAVKGKLNTAAFARYNVNIRNIPSGKNSKVLTSLRQGQRVEVLSGKTPRGWVPVMLEDGQIGYVGSVSAQSRVGGVISFAASELPRAQDLALIERWRGQLEQGRSGIEIKLGAINNENFSQASRAALLQGLRIRALIEAQGVARSRLSLHLDSPDVPADTVNISLMKEAL